MIHTDGRPTVANAPSRDTASGPATTPAELAEPPFETLRLNLTPFDFELRRENTLVLLRPCNDAARSWIDEHLYADANGGAPTWFGDSVVIELRYAGDIVEAILGEGFEVDPS